MADLGRRGFLKLLGLGTVAAAATTLMPETGKLLAFVEDPERALWVPGAKKIFDLHQPVREATLQEQAFVSGERMLRIKRGQDIFVMSEKAYAAGGGLSGLSEVHFDNGTVAYLGPGLHQFKGAPNMDLESIRSIADAGQAANLKRQQVPESLYREDFTRRMKTWGNDAKHRSEDLARHAEKDRRRKLFSDESNRRYLEREALKIDGPADPDRIVLTDQE